MFPNFPNGWGVFVFALVRRDKVQNSLVAFADSFTFSNHHHFKPPASALA
jgi:hypothetical protein